MPLTTPLAQPSQEIHPGAFSSERALHPPAFSLDHALSDWPHCILKVRCPCSPQVTLLPARFLSEQHGNRPFKAILAALRCQSCRGKPAPVYLVAEHHREPGKGTGPDWSLVLVALPGDQASG